MTRARLAFLVHLFTATGAVFAFLAMSAAVQGDWPQMFLWLGVALLVDGVDGPMARRLDVKTAAPRIDGVILDLVIDFVTYVFIPAIAIAWSGLVEERTGLILAGAIVLSGAIYFADTAMKTADNSFQGFPGCWNMAALTFFATEPAPWVVAALIILIIATTHLPLKFIHPVRTKRWRPLTLAVTALWFACGAITGATGFAIAGPVVWLVMASGLYLFFAGMAQQAMARV